MPQFKDLTGVRFGTLTVVERAPSENGATRWVCRCDCGGRTVVRGGNLTAAAVTSCGCRQRAPQSIEDMTGRAFGRLVCVERRGSSPSGDALWLFRCTCGTEVVIPGQRARSGGAKSCGCLRADVARASRLTHGMTRTPTYRRWESVKQRCLNPHDPRFADYGGRGITICDEWADSFEAFYAYVGDRPPGRTLDRIDNDLGYQPGNVRWATASEQANNRRAPTPSVLRCVAKLEALGWTCAPPDS